MAPSAAPTTLIPYTKPMVRAATRGSSTSAWTRNGRDMPIRVVGTTSARKCMAPALQGSA
jgi:hypothetical protein